MGRIIGIDLGTTNTVAAYWKRRRPRVIENDFSTFTPSVVWIEDGVRHVGHDAKARMASGGVNQIYSIKRFIGIDYDDPKAQEAISRVAYPLRRADNGEVEVLVDGGYYSPVQISAMTLKRVKEDAEMKLGEEVTHAVITVPAYFGQRQKNATREAGQLAGLVVSRIISEPTAAALAFGVEEKIGEPQDVLVYDLGGGTFDVSILSIIDNNFDVLNVDGDRFLGGDDFDDLLVQEMLHYILREYSIDLQDNAAAKMRLKALAEKVKIELSRHEESRVINSAIAQIAGRPIDLDITITRSQFESLISSLVEKSIDIVNRALEGAGIRSSDLDRVLLVGGSTRIPIIRQKLKDVFGDKIEIDVDPMQCVSLGAAVQTAFLPEDELQGGTEEQKLALGEVDTAESTPITPVIIDKAENLPKITMQDMLSKFIGVETEGGEIVSVIPKGISYPTHEVFRQIFQTNRTGQQVYELPIYESEVEDAPKEQWEWIGIIQNHKLPPGLPKSSDIMVEMSIDKDGILYITSYLKNDPLWSDPEKGTLEKHSFNFGGKANTKTRTVSDPVDSINFHMYMFDVIAHSPGLNKYIEQQHIRQLEVYLEEGKAVLETGDKTAAQDLLDKMLEYRAQLPSPTEDIFFASLISNNKDIVTLLDRSEMQQEMSQMENSLARGDMDAANEHLRKLREKTSEMFDKYPSNLLSRK